jgi:hypothetical protein
MVDYKKFDDIETDSEDENPGRTPDFSGINTNAPLSMPPQHPEQTKEPMTKKSKEGRIKFEHNGVTIYEWEQSLNEVNIYMEPPKEIPRKLIEVVISHGHVKVGLKDVPPFIDEDTGGPIIPSESLWTISDGVLNINLQKMNKAEAWDCALKGHTGQVIDAFTKEETKKKLLLERFQEEVC